MSLPRGLALLPHHPREGTHAGFGTLEVWYVGEPSAGRERRLCPRAPWELGGRQRATRPRVAQSAGRSLGGVRQCQLAEVPVVSVCVVACVAAVCERWGGGGEERGGGRGGGGCGVAVWVD